MASSQSYVTFIVDKLSPLGEVTVRKMMGEYCLYLNGKLVGDICDDTLFLKKFDTNAEFLQDCLQSPPYEGAKPMYVPDVDDDTFLLRAVQLTYDGAPERKKK